MANFTENYTVNFPDYAKFGIRSSIFYRLVKETKNCKGKPSGRYDVYDFHTVINGNMWYRHVEDAELSSEGNMGHRGYIGKEHRIPADDTKGKEYANHLYRELQSKGYKCIGQFEMDRSGYTRRIR